MPANSHGISDTLDVLRGYRRAGVQIEEMIADRGLTFTVAEEWAEPLAELGVRQVLDMHPADRDARRHPKHGYVMIDGWPHVPGTPEHLINIPRPARMTVGELKKNPTPAERADHAARVAEVDRFHALIAERETYRFDPHGKTSSGARRFVSPARAGKLRCPGYPPSMHLQDVPDCAHPDGLIPECCTQATITVGVRVEPKLRQALPWGTPEWINSYARRTRVEGAFGLLQSPTPCAFAAAGPDRSGR